MKFSFPSRIIFNIMLSLTICSLIISHAASFGENETTSNNNTNQNNLNSINEYIPVIVAVTGLGLSSWWSVRQFKLATQGLTQQSYDKLRVDHFAQKKLLVSDSVLQKLVSIPGEDKLDIKSLKDDERKKIVMFYVTEFDLYERLWDEYNQDRITESEWIMWLIWLEKINSPLLEIAMNQFGRVFYPPAMAVIKKYFIDKKPDCKFCNKNFEDLEKVLKHLEENHRLEAGFKN